MIDFREITARVTVSDILTQAGITADRNRISCPIHNGNNPTAFAFTETVFCCFSCGASGGLIDLICFLYGCNRRESMRRLCDMAGITFDGENSGTGNPPHRRIAMPLSPHRRSGEYLDAESQLEWLVLRRYALEVLLRIVRGGVRIGKVPLVEFYAREQLYLYELEETDWRVPLTKYQVNQIRRRIINDESKQRARGARIRTEDNVRRIRETPRRRRIQL